MVAEGIALHKPGVCEAKHEFSTNNESVQQTTGAEGKALNFTRGQGKNTAQTADSEAKYE